MLADASMCIHDVYATRALREWAKLARDEAARKCNAIEDKAQRRWRTWVDEQLDRGAAALHEFTSREEIATLRVALLEG